MDYGANTWVFCPYFHNTLKHLTEVRPHIAVQRLYLTGDHLTVMIKSWRPAIDRTGIWTAWISRILMLTAILTLPACGSSPTMIDAAQEGLPGIDQGPAAGSAEAPETQGAVTDSGLGTTAYAEGPRVVCKKRRRTGSNRRISTCEKYIGSQPVRSVTDKDSAIIWGALPPGTRPSN
jgi:hypothetical protein